MIKRIQFPALHSILGITCLFFIFCVFFTGCFSPFNGGDTGLITFNFGGNGRSAIWPPSDSMLEDMEYKITLTGDHAQVIEAKGNGIISAAVYVGNYNISVNAYYNGQLYAIGSASAEVKPGQTTPVSIIMGRPQNIPDFITITFDANGATGGTAPDPRTIEGGTGIEIPGAGGLVKTGFYFGGWNTQIDGSGTTYYPNSYFIPLNDTILYALWDDGTTASGAVLLENNIWSDSTSTSFGAQYFRFPVVSGETYRVFLNRNG
ncbi:MAG: InlB B-repeat-containing protein, partial [Treponema sp.]|nr:InlB B-repeat-containing protein [Treponema sp.]